MGAPIVVAGAAFPAFEPREETTMLATEPSTIEVLAVTARCRIREWENVH